MYSTAAILALVAPLACATIVIQAPTNFATNSPATITWSSNSPGTDPSTFSIELVNENFHNSFAIANNVLTTQGSITITLPTIPTGAGYSVEFVNITNINDVFASTGQFDVAPASSVTGTSTGSAASGSSAGSVSVTATGIPATTSGFGTTVGSSATGAITTGSTATSSGSQSSSTTATSTSFNGAVARSSNSYTALALSAFAGVALLAL